MARASWEQEATAMAGLQQHPSDHRRPRSPTSCRNRVGRTPAVFLLLHPFRDDGVRAYLPRPLPGDGVRAQLPRQLRRCLAAVTAALHGGWRLSCQSLFLSAPDPSVGAFHASRCVQLYCNPFH